MEVSSNHLIESFIYVFHSSVIKIHKEGTEQ